MDSVNVSELVERLGSDEDAVRKMAAFKLQTSIADPSFADAFTNYGGITKLRWLALHASGNTLAYSLTAFSKLLEVDMGWDYVDQVLVKRVVELVVTHPLVNILRGAMSILAAVVSHPHANLRTSKDIDKDTFGFRALKPAIASFPQFLEMLVNRLLSADHALCTNALQLINALIRDAITTGSEHEWPKLVKRLQNLGVIRAVYGLMQGSALQDLAQPLIDFQSLTKVLLRKWKEVSVDFERSEHQRAANGMYRASLMDPDQHNPNGAADSQGDAVADWTRLGFMSNSVAEDFQDVGFLGMMDLADYVRRHEDTFQRILLEQSEQQQEQRCPLARASIAVTSILYEHFEIDKADIEDSRSYMALDSRTNFDRMFKPLLLQWSRLHMSGLQAFLRLWKATGADTSDFGKVAELVRILLEAVIGSAARTKEIHDIEEEIQAFSYQRLRELQMELLELTYEDSWGHYLRQVREELNHEALQFIKEQRIRCLLKGDWFPALKSVSLAESGVDENEFQWGFVKLSHNRRHLHYFGSHSKGTHDPTLDEMFDKIDLNTVSSVVSNVTATPQSPATSTSTVHQPQSSGQSQTRISINGILTPDRTSHSQAHRKTSSTSSPKKEMPLLTLYPSNHALAAEWLDGLLMLLNQPPITSETKNLLSVVSDWGLKIRLLNVNYDSNIDPEDATGLVPSREGLDENYYYDVFGGP